MSSKLIEALIEHELGKEALEDVAGMVDNGYSKQLNKVNLTSNGVGVGKIPYKPIRESNTLITASCSNRLCNLFVALNPRKVKFGEIKLVCQACNSPLLVK